MIGLFYFSTACSMPSGMKCEVCNYKIRNKLNMNRYLLCSGTGAGRGTGKLNFDAFYWRGNCDICLHGSIGTIIVKVKVNSESV